MPIDDNSKLFSTFVYVIVHIVQYAIALTLVVFAILKRGSSHVKRLFVALLGL